MELMELIVLEVMPYLLGVLGLTLLWELHSLSTTAGRIRAVNFWELLSRRTAATTSTHGDIHGAVNLSVFLMIEVGVGYALWQVISLWYAWVLAFFVVTVIIGQVGYRSIPKLSGPIVDHFVKDKVDAPT